MSSHSTIVLISASGFDADRVMCPLVDALAKQGADLLHVRKSAGGRTYALTIVAQLTDGNGYDRLVADVERVGRLAGANARVSRSDDTSRFMRNSGARHALTAIGRPLKPDHVVGIENVLHRNDACVTDVRQLSVPLPAAKREASCIEWLIEVPPARLTQMRQELRSASVRANIDVFLQHDDLYRLNRRMLCLDLDSTLIAEECIDELARAAGVEEPVKRLTKAAMNGEIGFRESLRQRIGLLKGLSAQTLDDLAGHLVLSPGAERLIRTVRSVGFRTAILSGGFAHIGRRLQVELGVDHLFANELEVKDGKLTGLILGEVVDGERKASLMSELAARERVRLEQVVAVGDGANDLPMLREAGLGIAYRGKPSVRASAPQLLDVGDLDDILYLLGFRREHFADG